MADRCTGDAACGVNLIANLSKVADNIRGVAGAVGLRPYTVSIIKVRWTGGRRGDGVPEVIDTLMLDPTPLVSSISDLDQRLESYGLATMGIVQVSEISLRYDEDVLLGNDEDGTPPADDVEVFYEIALRTSLQGDPVLRRFTPVSTPAYDPGNLQYSIRLTAARGGRDRYTGLPQ